MNSQHRAIRALLSSMSPKRAIEYIKSFELRPDEEVLLIECDVHGLSYIQASEKFHFSPDVIKRRRKMAYGKISDELNHKIREGQGN